MTGELHPKSLPRTAKRPWRPRLTMVAMLVGLIAFAVSFFGPAVQAWDESLRESATRKVEKPVEILGLSMTMSYAKVDRRGLHEQPIIVFLPLVMGAGLLAASVGLRSLTKGRRNWPGAVGFAAGSGAIATTLILVPLSWLLLLLLIPGFVSVIASAAFAGLGADTPDALPDPGLDVGLGL